MYHYNPCLAMFRFVVVALGVVFALQLAVVVRADLLHGTWTTLAPMNVARFDPFVAAVDGKLYVAGGNVNGANPTSNVLERYNPATDTWTTLAPMPSGRYRGGVAVLGSKIYFIGGWNPPTTFIPTSTVQIYDTVSDSWSSGPGMPILSGSGPTGAINGKIYKHTAENGFSSAAKQFHVLDPGVGFWTSLSNPPNDHSGGASGVFNDKLFVAAGTDNGYGSGGGVHAQVHAYDPVTNGWSTLTTGSTARQGVASGTFADQLLIAGGDSGGSPLTLFETYDMANDTWHTLPSMPSALVNAGGAVIGNKFYVVGGSYGTTESNALLVYTIPEPATAVLAGVGMAFVASGFVRRRRR